ncbi:MAG: endonuclease/exonuclease/phosphatase family protein [Planctomycetota bacterium]
MNRNSFQTLFLTPCGGASKASLRLAMAIVLAASSSALAIDLRIASWNVGNLPNTAAQELELQEILVAIGNESVLGTARPIDILALAETDTASAPDTVAVFNTAYATSSYATAISTPDGGGDRTGFIYNTDTVTLLGTTELSAGLTHNLLRGEFRPVGTGGEADFFYYAIHLQSGDTTAFEDQRAAETQLIRDDADTLGLTTPIIYGGDFNWNDVDESTDPNNAAWDVITGAGAGQGFDTFDITNVAGAGNWRDNPAFLDLHTQDPGASMDDRFSVQFVTDEFFDGAGLELVQGSFRVFGNNGTHTLNEPITTGTGASASVLDALASFSDHLPVISDFRVLPDAIVPEPSTLWLFVVALAGPIVTRRR